jgi:hypothetical protein
VQFADINNDGLDDIFIAKGNVEQMPDAAQNDPNSLLLQQGDGRFFEASVEAGIASMSKSRGGALADLNNDGWLDLVVVNRGSQLEVSQNQPQSGNWLLLDVSQDGPNRMAVGGFIEVETAQRLQTRELTVGGGHASGIAGFHHFGLGAHDAARVRVIWPDGQSGDWQEISANQIAHIRR